MGKLTLRYMKITNYALVCAFLLIFLTTSVLAYQDQTVQTQQQKQFAKSTMIRTFSSLTDPGKTYVEMYISVINGQFRFIPQDDGFLYALVRFKIEIQDKDGNTVDSQEWDRAIKAKDMAEAERLSSLEITKFLVEPGTYGLIMTLKDMFANEESSESLLGWSVTRYPSSILSISDIEFATNIVTTEEQNDFVKHGIYYVEPYPARVYNNSKPIMFFYSEIYNLGRATGDDDTYSVEVIVADIMTGTQVYRDIKTRKKPDQNLAIIADKLNILNIRNGRYVLYIKVTDNKTGLTSEKKDEFVVFKPNDIAAGAGVARVELEITPNNIQDHWNQVQYLVHSGQKRTFESLNFEGQRKFIIDFWNARPAGDYKKYLDRFNFADKTYKSIGTAGWRSDRGRIYIMYGPPSELETHPTDPGMKPWEDWIYENLMGQGRVDFIFGDLIGFGNFELLHTNVVNEIRTEIFDPGWQERLIIR
ncbi:GWxTD domain-containing protein [candidate division KSB1 bacterium]